ncbi:MAG: class I SAM-dependent methyltransferase [Terriglobales bacterium]
MEAAAPAAELQRQERAYRERAVTWRGSRRMSYQWQVELEAVLARLRPRPGLRVLDAGCGVGRLSCAALRAGASVVSVDFALHRLQHLRRQAPAHRPAQLCQADVTQLPLREPGFDAVVCTQVLEHIPDPAARRRLLAAFAAQLRPGGECLLTVYNFSLAWRRQGQPREGLHASGVFYHCYDAAELRADLEGWDVLELCGIIHLLPHTWRLFPLLGPVARPFDHALERRGAFSRRWGLLLLAHARRR